MKKILIILIIGILFIPKVIYANNVEDLIVVNERINDIYFRKQTPGVLKWHFYGDVLRRQSDNHWVYSIEPGMKLDNKPVTPTNDVSKTTAITSEQWEKVKLYAYYGYNYQDEEHDHSDIKWYIITQLLIWRHLRLDWDIYFTDIYNGTKVIKYENELWELESLVDNHSLIPDLEKDSSEININETLEIYDKNSVIDQYEIDKTEGLDLIIRNNKLIITGIIPGNYKVKLYKQDKFYSEEPLLYTSEYLDTMSPGKLSKEIIIDIIVTGGKITIENSNNDESLSYLIFDNNDNIIDEIIINNNFGQNSIPLNYGNYYIIDNQQNKVYFEISQDTLNQYFIIKNKEKEILTVDNENNNDTTENNNDTTENNNDTTENNNDKEGTENTKDIIENYNDKTIDYDLNNNFIRVKVPVTSSKVFNFKYMIKEYNIPKISYYDKKKRKV